MGKRARQYRTAAPWLPRFRRFPLSPPPPTPSVGPPAATFFNIGADSKTVSSAQTWAAEVLKKRAAENSKDNPDAHCLPMASCSYTNIPQPRKIIQTPGVTVIVYEANSGSAR